MAVLYSEMEKTSLAVHFAVLNLVLSQIGVKNELRMLKIGDNYKKTFVKEEFSWAEQWSCTWVGLHLVSFR